MDYDLKKNRFTLRQLTKKDAAQYNALFRYAFQVTNNELSSLGWKEKEIQKTKSPIMEKAEAYGWFDQEKLVSQICTYPMQVNIYGKMYKMGGITGVATYPEYSGMGLMQELMKQSLTKMKERGQYISFLCPYSIPFYRKKGWEVVSDKMQYSIKDTQLPKKVAVSGMVERVLSEDKILFEIHDKFTLLRHGALKRNKLEWEEYWKWDSDDVLVAVYYNINHEALGYVVYYLENEIFKIKEMIYLNQEAYHGLWNYVINHFSMITDVKGYNYTNEPIAFVLEDSEITETITPNVMARIVDFEGFIKDFPFDSISIHNNLHFKLTDAMMECNNGDFSLSWDKKGKTIIEKGGTTGELVECDIQTLVCMFLGYKSPTYLKKIEHVNATKKAIRILEDIIPNESPYFSDYF